MIKRFLDWYVKAPTIIAIPLLPILLILYVIALPINLIKESRMFKNFITRIRTNLAKRNAKSKRLWARVEGPDQIIRPFWFGLFTVVFTALAAMTIYNLLTIAGGPVQWVSEILVITADGSPFEQVYAAFGIAVLVLVNLTIYSVYAFFAHADEDDVIEVIQDLDANVMERLAEIENNISERLSKLETNA